MSTQYVSTTDTSKIIRRALKAVFPETKFSVRSHYYAGGSSIDIKWTDGPARKRVEAITSQFCTTHFDGMTDCYDYSRTEWQGQVTSFGPSFIFCYRNISNWEARVAEAEAYIRANIHENSILKGQKPEWDMFRNRRIDECAEQLVWGEDGALSLAENFTNWLNFEGTYAS